MKLIAVPVGLTGALQLKVTGEQPSEFSAEVKPCFEVEHWYLAGQARTTSMTANVQAEGNSIRMPIAGGPTGRQAWWIQGVSGVIAFVAGNTAPSGVSMQLQLDIPSQGVAFASVMFPPIAALAGSFVAQCERWFDRPLIAYPGQVLVLRNNATLGQATGAQLQVLYTPVDI